MARSPRTWSERKVKWALNFYPPFLFQRIRVKEVGTGFRYCRVQVRKSLLNRNLSGTIFGGTIYAAADPVLAVLYWQIFAHEGERLQVWLKSGSADYRRPAASHLTLEFRIEDADLAAVRTGLEQDGKVIRSHTIEARDTQDEVCALIETAVYLRRIRQDQQDVSGF